MENFLDKEESSEKIDVSELLSSSNTLTNPNSKKKNHIELWYIPSTNYIIIKKTDFSAMYADNSEIEEIWK